MRSIAAASTLAVVSASEPCSAGSDTRTALAAPIASAVRRPETSLFGAIDTSADLAAAGGVDELQRHLDAVAVGLVEDQLAFALQRVGRGIERPRHGRVRDLLDADDDVHGVVVCRRSAERPQIGAAGAPACTRRGLVLRLAC